MGLNFKLDVGLYQLDPAGRLSAYRQTYIDAKTPISEAKEAVANLFARSDFSYALAA